MNHRPRISTLPALLLALTALVLPSSDVTANPVLNAPPPRDPAPLAACYELAPDLVSLPPASRIAVATRISDNLQRDIAENHIQSLRPVVDALSIATRKLAGGTANFADMCSMMYEIDIATKGYADSTLAPTSQRLLASQFFDGYAIQPDEKGAIVSGLAYLFSSKELGQIRDALATECAKSGILGWIGKKRQVFAAASTKLSSHWRAAANALDGGNKEMATMRECFELLEQP